MVCAPGSITKKKDREDWIARYKALLGFNLSKDAKGEGLLRLAQMAHLGYNQGSGRVN